ncbi:hypothetical protein IU448_23755 [Nocardia flavorosea]|uniref:hypothetical protein n=1 Tax=Nocardia flavorosea TaxID=53429 RepID=UPI001895FDCD|nr:hypothetical protein [Nocardia flavorosea]MBF6352008.1 hypothetical protein [Nocardia flavorosea]
MNRQKPWSSAESVAVSGDQRAWIGGDSALSYRRSCRTSSDTGLILVPKADHNVPSVIRRSVNRYLP